MEDNHEDLTQNRELSAFLAILALFAVLVALNPSYFSLQTLGMIFASAQILILLAIGAALVMLTRNIDVSVGSTVGLSAIAVGVALNGGYSLPVSILLRCRLARWRGVQRFSGGGAAHSGDCRHPRYAGAVPRAMLLWTGGKWIEGLPPGLKSLRACRHRHFTARRGSVDSRCRWRVGLSRTAFGRDFTRWG